MLNGSVHLAFCKRRLGDTSEYSVNVSARVKRVYFCIVILKFNGDRSSEKKIKTILGRFERVVHAL